MGRQVVRGNECSLKIATHLVTATAHDPRRDGTVDLRLHQQRRRCSQDRAVIRQQGHEPAATPWGEQPQLQPHSHTATQPHSHTATQPQPRPYSHRHNHSHTTTATQPHSPRPYSHSHTATATQPTAIQRQPPQPTSTLRTQYEHPHYPHNTHVASSSSGSAGALMLDDGRWVRPTSGRFDDGTRRNFLP